MRLKKGISLKSYQEEAKDRVLQEEATLLVLPTGSGKTLTSLTSFIDSGYDRCIYVTIASVVFQLPREVESKTNDIITFPANASPKKREAAYLKFATTKNSILVISYNILRNDVNKVIKILDEFNFIPMLILDEATAVANTQTKNYKACDTLSEFCGKRIAMSASTRNLSTLNNMMKCIGARYLSTRDMDINHIIYRNKTVRTRFGRKIVREIVGYKNLDKFNEKVGTSKFEKSKKEILTDLPPFSILKYQIPKSKSFKEAIKIIQRKYDSPPLAYLLIAAGTPSLFDSDLKNDKFDIVHQIMDNNPESKFLVYTDYRKPTNLINEYLNSKGIRSVKITNEESDIKPQIIDDFINNDKIRALCANQSISHGVDGLHRVCSDLIFLIPTLSSEIFQQVAGRLSRIGGKEVNKINLHFIFMEDTLDVPTYEKVQNDLRLVESINNTIDDGLIDKSIDVGDKGDVWLKRRFAELLDFKVVKKKD